MKNSHQLLLFVLAISLAMVSFPAVAQMVVATVTVGGAPDALAVNPATNKTYVANLSSGTVTVIDGTTFSTQTVTVGTDPDAVAVNSVTNKIYTVNRCGNDVNCQSLGTVTVIDGATNKTQTLTMGYFPNAVAVNPVTNKIYVANSCGSDPTCKSNGTVTVIDGATLTTQAVTVEIDPMAVAANSVTNKIYAANYSSGTVTAIDGTTLAAQSVSVGVLPTNVAINSVTNKIYVSNCGSDSTCKSNGTLTVIDGATLTTSNVGVGVSPLAAAVDAVTNKIYVINYCGGDPNCHSTGTVTVVNGVTLATQTVTVGSFPDGIAADAVTNEIYVANRCGSDPTCGNPKGTVTAINGLTNTTTSVAVGNVAWAVAINSVTDRIYVPNYADGTVSVIAGVSNPVPLQFVSVTPCRLVDTRNPDGEFGGPPLQAQSTRNFAIPDNKTCNIPTSAVAYSLNVTVVPYQPLGYLTAWPTGEDQPYVSTLNSTDGRVKANAAIVPAGYQGAVSFYVTNMTDLVLDIDGYFTPVSSSTLAFYPLTPCRVIDTRTGQGGTTLQGDTEYNYKIQGICGIPSTAQAYSFNFTVVPVNKVPVGYLTVWPQGQTQPNVSTLNDRTGTVVANAGIVPEGGNGGEISAYASTTGQTDLLVDVNGYFAPAGQGGLSLYPVAPCRVLDTRPHPFQFELSPPVDVLGSVCAPPSQSQAYVFNATVVPQGGLGYLTLWPDGGSKPFVSTLNSYDATITSNMAIVPAGNNGKIDAYANPINPNDPNDVTDLLLDISSYFAP